MVVCAFTRPIFYPRNRRDVNRRAFLQATVAAATGAGLAGCRGEASSPKESTTPTPGDGTRNQTSSPTPVPFPDSCAPLPDLEGRPSRPAELNDDTVREYVTGFERLYAVETIERYRAIDRVTVTDVRAIGERYRVELEVEANPGTATPGADGETPTSLPPDGRAHRALYRVGTERMVRERRGFADGATLSSQCWTLDPAEN